MSVYLELVEFLGEAFVHPDEPDKKRVESRPMEFWVDLRTVRGVFLQWHESGKPVINVHGAGIGVIVKTWEDAQRLGGKILDKVQEAEYEDMWKRQVVASSLHSESTKKNLEDMVDRIKKW